MFKKIETLLIDFPYNSENKTKMKNIISKIFYSFVITIGVLIMLAVFLTAIGVFVIILKNIPPIKLNDWLIALLIIGLSVLTIFGLSKIPDMIYWAYKKLKIK